MGLEDYGWFMFITLLPSMRWKTTRTARTACNCGCRRWHWRTSVEGLFVKSANSASWDHTRRRKMLPANGVPSNQHQWGCASMLIRMRISEVVRALPDAPSTDSSINMMLDEEQQRSMTGADRTKKASERRKRASEEFMSTDCLTTGLVARLWGFGQDRSWPRHGFGNSETYRS